MYFICVIIARKLTPSVLIDVYMRHTFECTGCGMTHICVIQSNTPGADWRVWTPTR